MLLTGLGPRRKTSSKVASEALSVIPATQETEAGRTIFTESVKGQPGPHSETLQIMSKKRAECIQFMPKMFQTLGSVPNIALPLWPLASLASRLRGVVKNGCPNLGGRKAQGTDGLGPAPAAWALATGRTGSRPRWNLCKQPQRHCF